MMRQRGSRSVRRKIVDEFRYRAYPYFSNYENNSSRTPQPLPHRRNEEKAHCSPAPHRRANASLAKNGRFRPRLYRNSTLDFFRNRCPARCLDGSFERPSQRLHPGITRKAGHASARRTYRTFEKIPLRFPLRFSNAFRTKKMLRGELYFAAAERSRSNQLPASSPQPPVPSYQSPVPSYQSPVKLLRSGFFAGEKTDARAFYA